jgi:hypothetical protein
MLMRSALLWDITRLRVVIVCRRFGTTYRSHLHGSRVREGRKIPEDRRPQLHRGGSLSDVLHVKSICKRKLNYVLFKVCLLNGMLYCYSSCTIVMLMHYHLVSDFNIYFCNLEDTHLGVITSLRFY